MTVTTDELLARGYRKHPAGASKLHADALYQRWMRDDKNTKLFALNWWLYTYPPSLSPTGATHGWTVESRMYSLKDSWDLAFFMEPTSTLLDVELFYLNAYANLGCCPDRHNQ